MAVNKQQKVLLGLLGSAGLILVVDQLVLAPPQGANAGQAGPTQPQPQPGGTPAQDASATAASADEAAKSSASVRDWNSQLEVVAGTEPPANPFAVPEQREPEVSDVMSPQEFTSQHKLTAVLTGGDIGVAMINGTAVHIGQEVGGYRLIRVDSRSAEFRAGELVVHLSLPQQVGGGS